MPRYAVVHSDTESAGEEACSITDSMSDVSNEAHSDAGDPFCTVVEALEYGLRNVPLHGAHLRDAEAALRALQGTSSVLYHQAVSPRWPPAFVAVLERARMARVRFLLGDDAKQVLRAGTGCHMCGASEHRCQNAFELIGGDACGLGSCTMATLSDATDQLEDSDRALCASHEDAAFLGAYAGGQRCFDLAMAAVVARNLVTDTCYDLHAELHRLMTPALATQLERDERDPTRPIYALTPIGEVAARLSARVAAVQDVLRGCHFPDATLGRTGHAAVWARLDESLRARFHFAEARMRWCGARAAALLGRSPPEEADDDDDGAPVSSRTRAKATKR
jgi:hypothetical protein